MFVLSGCPWQNNFWIANIYTNESPLLLGNKSIVSGNVNIYLSENMYWLACKRKKTIKIGVRRKINGQAGTANKKSRGMETNEKGQIKWRKKIQIKTFTRAHRALAAFCMRRYNQNFMCYNKKNTKPIWPLTLWNVYLLHKNVRGSQFQNRIKNRRATYQLYAVKHEVGGVLVRVGFHK